MENSFYKHTRHTIRSSKTTYSNHSDQIPLFPSRNQQPLVKNGANNECIHWTGELSIASCRKSPGAINIGFGEAYNAPLFIRAAVINLRSRCFRDSFSICLSNALQQVCLYLYVPSLFSVLNWLD